MSNEPSSKLLVSSLSIRPIRAVLITPGAGASKDHQAVRAIDTAILDGCLGLATERIDFPYRIAGRKVPDKTPILIEAVAAAVDALAQRHGISGEEIAVGGRSMGGRMCSLAVAEGMKVAALFCVSYPLHPPGKPEKLRVDHFETVCIPTLFVSGTRDTFGKPDEFASHTPRVAGPFTQRWIEHGDHGLARRGHDEMAGAMVATWINELNARVPFP